MAQKTRAEEKGFVLPPEIVKLHSNPNVAHTVCSHIDVIQECLDVMYRSSITSTKTPEQNGYMAYAYKFFREQFNQLAEQGKHNITNESK